MARILLAVLIVLSIGTSTTIRVTFESQDVEYIAAEYSVDGEPESFVYDANQAEAVAFNPRKRLVYVIGESRLSVLKILRNKTLELLHTETITGYDLQSIQTCKNFVTVAARNEEEDDKDRLFVFRGYNTQLGGNLPMLHTINLEAGGPLHHVVTRDCKTIVVALERSGKIAVMRFRDPLWKPMVLILSFSAFANEQERLEREWFVLNIDGFVPFDQLLDPEWLCLNKRETKAFVSLRDNNGIAVVDLRPRREHVKRLRGLGLKNWAAGEGTMGFDGSTSPVKAELRNAPIFSAYNPSQIACQTIHGKDYVFLAGEGTMVGGDFVNSLNLEDGFPSDIQQSTQFGNVNIFSLSSLTDPDGDNKADSLVASGSRSYFAVSGKKLSVKADTKSGLEFHTMNLPTFNADPTSSETLLQDFDRTSLFRGPKPNLIITQYACRGRYIIMVGGYENPGGLFVYTLDTAKLNTGFVFQDQINGYGREDSVYDDLTLYSKRLLSLRFPKGVAFASGRHFGGRLSVVSASGISSSVELFDLNIDCNAMTPDEP